MVNTTTMTKLGTMKSKLQSGRSIVFIILIGFLLLVSPQGSKAQEHSEGNMTFTVRTVTVNGNFSPRHVLAIWVEDADGFVLSRKLRAEKRKQYLYTWNSQSGGDVTDANTGATLSSHQTHTVTWDCTDKDGAIVPDGEYKAYVEFTEAHVQGPLRMVAFTKGPEAVSLTPDDDENFKELALLFEPLVTVEAGFTFIADELKVDFTNTSTGAASYDWDFGDETRSQQENPSHSYAGIGTYEVTLKAISGSNSASDIQEVTVTSTVGIGVSDLDTPLIYPNPTNGFVSVNLDKDAGSSTIKIFASNGSLIYANKVQGRDLYKIDLSSYESGVYILSVEDQLRTYRQSIVKE